MKNKKNITGKTLTKKRAIVAIFYFKKTLIKIFLNNKEAHYLLI